jgi:hypothetical protein
MALWNIKSPQIAAQSFTQVQPAEVLDGFDGPMTFTFLDQRGSLMIANLCAIGGDATRYLVSETSELIINDLKNGLISLRDALIRNPLWLVDVDANGNVSRAWQTSLDDLPPEVIPDPDALLNDELEAEQRADEKLSKFAKSKSDGQVAFDGGPVENYEIEASFFGKFFQLATELLTEICVSLDAPRPILRLGKTFESSYAVDLKLAERSPEGDDLLAVFSKKPPSDEPSRLRRAFDALMSLVVDSPPSDEALTLIKRLYPLRQQYGKVLELLSTNGATVAIRTRNNPRSRTVSGRQAGERLRVVRELGYPYMFLEVRGMLIGGQTHKSGRTEPYFTIRVITKGKPQDYTGTVPNSVVEQMKKMSFDDEVWAKLQIREEAKDQGYELSEIRAAHEGSPHYVK